MIQIFHRLKCTLKKITIINGNVRVSRQFRPIGHQRKHFLNSLINILFRTVSIVIAVAEAVVVSLVLIIALGLLRAWLNSTDFATSF